MIKPTTMIVLFKSGQRHPIHCASHEDASRIVVEIATYMMEGLPIISVESDTTAAVLGVAN